MQIALSKFRHLTLIFAPFLIISQTHAAKTPNEVLWDNWYTVSQNNSPDSYYNEKAEIAGDRVKIQVNTWVKKNGKIVAENLGAYSKNTKLLEPLLFNFRTNDGGIEKSIDGTILNNGKVFSIKITKNGNTSVPLRAEMLPKLILTSFFPVWINKNYNRITGVQPIEFMAIVEDQVEKEVPVVKGSVYEMLNDEFSKETHTRKLRIVFNQVVCFWYVTPKGDAVKISVPAANKTVVKVTKEKAQEFLK